MPASRLRFFKQGIAISGLGSKQFDFSQLAVDHIHSLLRRGSNVPGAIQTLPSIYCGSYDAIEAENRYLTPGDEIVNQGSIPIPKNVDPKDILQKLCDMHNYHYTEENTVIYTEPKEANGR
jgi:hypothetical protein